MQRLPIADFLGLHFQFLLRAHYLLAMYFTFLLAIRFLFLFSLLNTHYISSSVKSTALNITVEF